MKKDNLMNGAKIIITAGTLVYGAIVTTSVVKEKLENRRLRNVSKMMNEFDFDTAETNSNVVRITERNLGEVEL